MYLESLVLQDSLDGRILAIGRDLRLEYHSEGAIAYDLALGVLHLPRLASEAILNLLPDDLYIRSLVSKRNEGHNAILPPMRKLLKTPGLF